MKILLSYSKVHFDPLGVADKKEYRCSSASILARTLYLVLSEIGDVVYLDYDEPVLCQEFDLFVGISNGFYRTLKSIHCKRNILFAVNMHPKDRKKMLQTVFAEYGATLDAYVSYDFQPLEYIKGLESANCVICVGNDKTYHSYILNGIKRTKIKTINYGLPWADTHLTVVCKNAENKKFIYVATEIGIRKGFDCLFDMFCQIELVNQNYTLTIMGSLTNAFYIKKMNEFSCLLGERVTFVGWIDSTKQEYVQEIDKHDFMIFPSIEEGQAGTVLDCISRGVIPILSENCGFSFSPLGFLDFKFNSSKNVTILKNALSRNEKEIYELKNITLEYYREYHHAFQENLKELLQNSLCGQVYPKISVILPIFNKEKTIKELILKLNNSLNAYNNVELHIIFDGCIDQTEKIVRGYLRKHAHYDVTYELTPNIFEVKTNNIGLKKSSGKYCVIIQDDNYINDPNLFFEAINFLDNNNKAVILGGLAGVNFYPRGTTNLSGKGQIQMSDQEVYWRQDEKTDPDLINRIFQVDCCMRGPLIIRKNFLENHGYLDEIYAPLYCDDMDICFRANSLGYKVYCMIMDVENRGLTMANYDSEKMKFFDELIVRNTDILYKRYTPSMDKNYSWIYRNKLIKNNLNSSKGFYINFKEILKKFYCSF